MCVMARQPAVSGTEYSLRARIATVSGILILTQCVAEVSALGSRQGLPPIPVGASLSLVEAREATAWPAVFDDVAEGRLADYDEEYSRAKELLRVGRRRRNTEWQLEFTDVVSRALRLAATEAYEPLRRNMIDRICALYGPRTPMDALDGTVAGYLPVAAIDGDPERAVCAQVVATGHLGPDASRPTGRFRGPKVTLEVPAGYDGNGRFDGVRISLGTAFVAATRVIDSAERWAGHRIEWGRNGTLAVHPFGVSGDRFKNWYHGVDRVVMLGTERPYSRLAYRRPRLRPEWSLDSASIPDLVAHEAAHAVVSALKPGWRRGTTAVLSEAIADATAFLVAVEDWDVADAVFEETGGVLSRENEASRLCESSLGWPVGENLDGADLPSRKYLRSAMSERTLGEFGLDRQETNPCLWPEDSHPRADPHCIGQVVCGALYDVFACLCEKALADGQSRRIAVSRAASVVGTVMLRALAYVGEHRVSFDDYARALIRAENDIYAGLHASVFRRALVVRGLILSDRDDTQRVVSSTGSIGTIDPRLTEPVSLLNRIEQLEAERRRRLIDAGRQDRSIRGTHELLRREPTYPYEAEVPATALSLHSDLSAPDGLRVIRLSFDRLRLVRLPPGVIDPRNPGIPSGDLVPWDFEVFCSVVLDPVGEVLAIHADRPWTDPIGKGEWDSFKPSLPARD